MLLAGRWRSLVCAVVGFGLAEPRLAYADEASRFVRLSEISAERSLDAVRVPGGPVKDGSSHTDAQAASSGVVGKSRAIVGVGAYKETSTEIPGPTGQSTAANLEAKAVIDLRLATVYERHGRVKDAEAAYSRVLQDGPPA